MLAVAVALIIAASPQSSELVRHEVKFTGTGGLEMSGELTLPAAGSKVPAALLLAGSGPNDRNGNSGPSFSPNVLLYISTELAKMGVATFRFDKRSNVRYKDKWPKEAEAMSEYQSFESLVGDGRAAYLAMKNHARVSTDKLAIIGHSAGGLEALHLAAELHPDGLILLATAGRPYRELLLEQVANSLDNSKVADPMRKDILDSLTSGIEYLATTGQIPEKVHPAIAPLLNKASSKLIRSYLTIDPLSLVAKIDCRTHIVNGDMDAQIDAKKDAERLFKAFGLRKTATSSIMIIPNASHNFKRVEEKTDPGVIGPLEPALIRSFREFVSTWRLRSE